MKPKDPHRLSVDRNNMFRIAITKSNLIYYFDRSTNISMLQWSSQKPYSPQITSQETWKPSQTISWPRSNISNCNIKIKPSIYLCSRTNNKTNIALSSDSMDIQENSNLIVPGPPFQIVPGPPARDCPSFQDRPETLPLNCISNSALVCLPRPTWVSPTLHSSLRRSYSLFSIILRFLDH